MGPTREHLLHRLYEAAELEHTLMCTYLYAAFSLRQGEDEGLNARQAMATAGWRRSIVHVALEEMAHLATIANLTAALGGSPRWGRANFPLDPGLLPARLVVRLAPFNAATLQHFIFLERPAGSAEPEGDGFAPALAFERRSPRVLLTPTGLDYDTVGDFYATLADDLALFAQREGEARAFSGPAAAQLSAAELGLADVRTVRCLACARAALQAIVDQGEGAGADTPDSHFRRFVAVRDEWAAMRAEGEFSPAWPAATNPVLRRPPLPGGRVWIEDDEAVALVDLANASYGLMLRLLAAAWDPAAGARRSAWVGLALGTMRAMVPLAEAAARRPAGPSNPDCHAGVSFTTLRDAAALPSGVALDHYVAERLHELAQAATELAGRTAQPRTQQAAGRLQALALQAAALPALPMSVAFAVAPSAPAPAVAAPAALSPPAEVAPTEDGVENAECAALTLHFEARRCIHARHCVTGAPEVFLANTPGRWLFPEAQPAARVVEIAHACPSGAIRYTPRGDLAAEAAPAVNLLGVREAGPYALRAELHIAGRAAGFRATLCRCGASARKPWCDGSHAAAGFDASGEPATGLGGRPTELLPQRGGALHIQPETDGPLEVTGALEIVSGTGRLVCRVARARLCRCGASASKPFCDNSHERVGFRSG